MWNDMYTCHILNFKDLDSSKRNFFWKQLNYHATQFLIINYIKFFPIFQKIFKGLLSLIKVKQKRKFLNKQNQYCRRYYFCNLIESWFMKSFICYLKTRILSFIKNITVFLYTRRKCNPILLNTIKYLENILYYCW